jgi:hypothetical protein
MKKKNHPTNPANRMYYYLLSSMECTYQYALVFISRDGYGTFVVPPGTNQSGLLLTKTQGGLLLGVRFWGFRNVYIFFLSAQKIAQVRYGRVRDSGRR